MAEVINLLKQGLYFVWCMCKVAWLLMQHSNQCPVSLLKEVEVDPGGAEHLRFKLSEHF